MGLCMAAYWILMMVTLASVTGKPVNTLRTQKRQSDQRIAELETLLALQKYGAHHFLRSQPSGDGEGSVFPAYGIIDFNKIGRKKKSSPPAGQDAESDEPEEGLILYPSSSWAAAPSSAHLNPSISDTGRVGVGNIGVDWKAPLSKLPTELDSWSDDTRK